MSRVRRFIKQYGWGYVFVLPSLITFALFTFVPVVWSFIISFQDFSLVRGGQWVEPIYANYVDAFTMLNGIFKTAIGNTIYYTIVTVTANILIGLILASLIQSVGPRLRSFFRAAYYLPAVTSTLIIGLTWAYIFNAQWGLCQLAAPPREPAAGPLVIQPRHRPQQHPVVGRAHDASDGHCAL